MFSHKIVIRYPEIIVKLFPLSDTIKVSDDLKFSIFVFIGSTSLKLLVKN